MISKMGGGGNMLFVVEYGPLISLLALLLYFLIFTFLVITVDSNHNIFSVAKFGRLLYINLFQSFTQAN